MPGPRLLLAGFGGATAVAVLDGGLTWRSTPRPTRGQSLNAICGYSPGAMFAVGGIDNNTSCPTCKVKWLERTVTASGPQWTSKDFQLGNTSQLISCYAEGPGHVWFTGDDSKFVYQSGGMPAYGDFGGGSLYGRYNGAWGNADAGYFFTRPESNEVTISPDGITGFASSMVNAGPALRSVWGLGRDDIMVVGLDGTTSRFDGMTWIAENTLAQTEFVSVHGSRLLDGGLRYVAAGTRGTLYSLDGDAGTVTELSPAVDFDSAWVSARGKAWAVGAASDGGAFVMRGEQGVWSLLPLSSPRPVTGVYGFDLEDGGVTIWVTGPIGMILRRAE